MDNYIDRCIEKCMKNEMDMWYAFYVTYIVLGYYFKVITFIFN